MTLVSVVIPTYNRNQLLMNRVLPSVIGQRSELEIIIVADGMADQDYSELVGMIADLDDHRIRMWNIPRQVYPENKWGLLAVDARNFGLDHVTGEWVSMLDDDDELLPGSINYLLGIAEATGADFVYGQSLTYKNGKMIGQLYGSWPPGDGTITHGAFLMRSGLGYRYAKDCYDRGLNADADLWTRMYRDGVKFHFEPKIVHHYHRNWP